MEPPKATAVAAIKNREGYSPEKDFYKPLREKIAEIHQKDLPKTELRRFLATISDGKKQSNYPAAIDGYLKWWGRQNLEWFVPPAGSISRSQVELSVSPELGIRKGDNLYLVKLYFKSETLTRNRSDIINHAMEVALRGAVHEGARMGVLDVRRSRLQESSGKTRLNILDGLLDAEFAYIASLWPRV